MEGRMFRYENAEPAVAGKLKPVSAAQNCGKTGLRTQNLLSLLA